MTETWKPIRQFPGYFISDLGQVKGPRKILKPQLNTHKNVWHVSLHRGERQYTWPIHRLVLEAFVGPCLDGEEGCHNDGNRANNKLTNLRWDTHVNNEADKVLHGTVARGVSNGAAKVNEPIVLEILSRASTGEAHRAIARDLNIGRRTVSHIVSRKTWGHVAWPEEGNDD